MDPNNNLTDTEMELIAALKDNVGYIILLDKIAATIDDLTDLLSRQQSSESEGKLLPFWRALKLIHVNLRMVPETFAKTLQVSRENFGTQADLEVKQELLKNTLEDLYRKSRKKPVVN